MERDTESGAATMSWDSILADSESHLVTVAFISGRGRVLRATRKLLPGELIVSVPMEHRVEMPQISKSAAAAAPDNFTADSKFEKDLNRDLDRDYAVVASICESVGNMHGSDVYWAALLSLTEEEGPAGRDWPCISLDSQSRLLLLFKPEGLSSTCKGRSLCPAAKLEADRDVQRAGLTKGPPQRTHRTRSTFDMVVQRLLECFSLSVSAEKLEALVLVWKYSSFYGSVALGQSNSLETYIIPSLANHSCIPNCNWYFDLEAGGGFVVEAGANGLEAGEEITISYLCSTDLLEMDTLKRREILAHSWLFFCECCQCSCIEPPTCRCCNSPGSEPMSVIMCRTEEPLYPGSMVHCDDCLLEDLQTKVGYFFHCDACAVDYCPSCAAGLSQKTKGRPGSYGEKFNGRWMHTESPDPGIEVVIGDTIRWATGSSSRICLEDERSFSVTVSGVTYSAELINEKLLWSDTDIWVRCPAEES